MTPQFISIQIKLVKFCENVILSKFVPKRTQLSFITKNGDLSKSLMTSPFLVVLFLLILHSFLIYLLFSFFLPSSSTLFVLLLFSFFQIQTSSNAWLKNLTYRKHEPLRMNNPNDFKKLMVKFWNCLEKI